jgi:hypothetical protein
VNNGWGPLCAYVGIFVQCLADGQLFRAAGYCVVLVLFASVTFLVAVFLGWLVQRVYCFFWSRQKDEHEVVA